jgi:hypothetical protein
MFVLSCVFLDLWLALIVFKLTLPIPRDLNAPTLASSSSSALAPFDSFVPF